MSGKNSIVVFVPMMVLGLLVTTFDASQIDSITCSDAISSMLPCLPFLEGSAPAVPSTDCCAGAKNVFQKADTTPVRRDLCNCFKSAATKFGVNPDRIKQLPHLCGITLSFSLNPKGNCSS